MFNVSLNGKILKLVLLLHVEALQFSLVALMFFLTSILRCLHGVMVKLLAF